MIGGHTFAYAQARLHARLGQRPAEAVWQSLQAIAEFRPFLEQARTTGLRPWLLTVSPITAPHEAERLLRAALRARIDEIVRWLPDAWRPAAAWTRVLVDLPAVAHLLRREPPLPWMLDEESLKALAAAEPDSRPAVLAAGDYASLARGAPDTSLDDRWLAEWWRRMPPLRRPQRRRLESLVATVRTPLRLAGPGEPALAPLTADRRRALEQRLVFHFRRAFLEPAAAYAYLLLLASEYQHLRGELMSRGWFGAETH